MNAPVDESGEAEALESEASPKSPKQDLQELKREIFDFAKLVVWFLVIFLVLRTYVVEGYEVQGSSMIPTLEDNQRILVFKLPTRVSQFSFFSGLDALEPGDIVVFDSPDNPNKRYVKRVIAKGPPVNSNKAVDAQGHAADEAEKVKVEFLKGDVFVNNRRIQEDYLRPNARVSRDTQKLYLDSGQYYVLGDNRPDSKDSRSFDAISQDRMIGKAVLRFWPPRKISFLN